MQEVNLDPYSLVRRAEVLKLGQNGPSIPERKYSLRLFQRDTHTAVFLTWKI
jgi:hypothetical protein